ITFVSPAQRLSRAFNHVGQNSMKIFSSSGSVLCGHQQTRLTPVVDHMRNTTPEPERPSRFGRVISCFGSLITHSGNVITRFGKMIARFGNR
ncbi:hypothetical protein, partial [Burkholderia glumae]